MLVVEEFWSIIRHLSQKIDGSEEIVNNLYAEVTECRTEVVEMSASNATQLQTAVDEMRGGLLSQSKQVDELTSFQSRLGEQQPLVEEAVAKLKELSQSHQELQEKLRYHTEERERDTQHLADAQSCLRRELEKVHRDHASAVEAHVLEAEERVLKFGTSGLLVLFLLLFLNPVYCGRLSQCVGIMCAIWRSHVRHKADWVSSRCPCGFWVSFKCLQSNTWSCLSSRSACNIVSERRPGEGNQSVGVTGRQGVECVVVREGRLVRQ